MFTSGVYGQLANRVPSNPKCNQCGHYLKNNAACEIGLYPTTCGDGTSPANGFDPIVDGYGPGPDAEQVVDFSHGNQSSVKNGQPEIRMATAHLGDASELIALSEQVIGDLRKSLSQGCAAHSRSVGYQSLHSLTHSQGVSCQCVPLDSQYAAREVHKTMSNTLRGRISVEAVRNLIVENKLV